MNEIFCQMNEKLHNEGIKIVGYIGDVAQDFTIGVLYETTDTTKFATFEGFQKLTKPKKYIAKQLNKDIEFFTTKGVKKRIKYFTQVNCT